MQINLQVGWGEESCFLIAIWGLFVYQGDFNSLYPFVYQGDSLYPCLNFLICPVGHCLVETPDVGHEIFNS